MPKDYKPRPQAPKKRREPASKWPIFFGGFLLGACLVGLLWANAEFQLLPAIGFPGQGATASESGRTPGAAAEKSVEKKQEPEVPKPRFDFYTILPEMEVVVSDPDEEPVPEASVAAETSETPQPVQSGGLYMLQMGSFRTYGDAERLKAKLALLGIVAEIQVVDVKGGGTFHRVRSGPMTGAEANRLRARLRQESINSLVMKLKK